MAKNETGAVFVWILLAAANTVVLIIGFLPYLTGYHRMVNNDLGHFQALCNAEAGVWHTLEEWRTQPAASGNSYYPLSQGSTGVTIRELDSTRLEIQSDGQFPPDFKAGITVVYDREKRQIVHWHE